MRRSKTLIRSHECMRILNADDDLCFVVVVSAGDFLKSSADPLAELVGTAIKCFPDIVSNNPGQSRCVYVTAGCTKKVAINFGETTTRPSRCI